MKTNFRQGLLSYQIDITGSPQFLLPSTINNYVKLNIAPTPTVATFAHYTTNYLVQFDQGSDTYWGPLVAGVDNFLFWDIDTVTARITTGITTLQPVYQETEPTKVSGLHWFDKTNAVMKVCRGSIWIPVIRLFAGKVANGNVNQIEPYGRVSQAGITGSFNAGSIILDRTGEPLRKANSEFFTDHEDKYLKVNGDNSGVLIYPTNNATPIRAAENIPARSTVYIDSTGMARLASSDPVLIGQKTPVGIIMQALYAGEIGNLIRAGKISDQQWDFSGSIGKTLYIDNFGALTTIRPQGLMAYSVGVISDVNTIMFNVDAETQPQIYTASDTAFIVNGQPPVVTTNSINQLGERVTTVSMPMATNLIDGYMSHNYVSEISSLGTRVGTLETNAGNLPINDVIVAVGNAINLGNTNNNSSNVTAVLGVDTQLQIPYIALISSTGTGGATNLSNTVSSTSVTINSSSGTGTSIPLATSSLAGLLAPAEKVKIGNALTGFNLTSQVVGSGIQIIASDSVNLNTSTTIPFVSSTVNGILDFTNFNHFTALYTDYINHGGSNGAFTHSTNLTTSITNSNITVLSDNGTDAILPLVTGSLSGLMGPDMFNKLSGIAANATSYSDAMAKAATAAALAAGTHTNVTVTYDSNAQSISLAATASGGATNLSKTVSATDILVISDTGTDVSLPLATTSLAGLMGPDMVTALNTVVANQATPLMNISRLTGNLNFPLVWANITSQIVPSNDPSYPTYTGQQNGKDTIFLVGNVDNTPVTIFLGDVAWVAANGGVMPDIGTVYTFSQDTDSSITFVAAAGTILKSPVTPVIGRKYGKVTLIRTGTNKDGGGTIIGPVWELEGNLLAA
jgi:hypothetical protein